MTPTLTPGQTWTPTRGRAKARKVLDVAKGPRSAIVCWFQVDWRDARAFAYAGTFAAWIARTGAVCRDGEGGGK